MDGLFCFVPVSADWFSGARAIALLALNLVLFVMPGIALCSWLSMRWPSLLRYALILTVVTSGVAGYLSFYIFLFSKTAGRVWVAGLYLASFLLMGLAVRSAGAVPALLKRVAEPLTLTALAALCYFSLTFLFVNPMKAGAGYVNGRFFSAELPGDNRIPFFLAERLYDRKPLRPFCCGGWLSSDRPPLQAGIFLMQRPLSLTSNVELDYQLLATGLQCLWICGVWNVLQSLGASIMHIRRALCLLIFSGVIFFNSVYVWPKFLTATLVLFAVSILIEVVRSRRKATSLDIVIVSTCLGLALISHPGSLFTLVAIGLFLIRFRSHFSYRHLAWAVPILLVFLLPWSAYQRWVDPPGNRLIKLHLAGVDTIGPSTALDEIRKAYANHRWQEIAALRWSNFAMLAGYKPFDTFGLYDLGDGQAGFSPNGKPRLGLREWNRTMQEKYLWNALGPLNLGWLAGLFLVWKKRSLEGIRYSGWLLAAVLVDTVVWCLVEFGPQYSLLAHLSFADFLLLNVALLGFLLELSRVVALAVLALELCNFFGVWIWSPPAFPVSLQLPLLLAGSLSAVALLVRLGRSLVGSAPVLAPVLPGESAYES